MRKWLTKIASQTKASIHVRAEVVLACTFLLSLLLFISLPSVAQQYDVTGGGLVCNNTGVTIKLSGSELDVEYELFLAGEATGITKIGTGEQIVFDGIINSGTYTIKKKTGNKQMNGSVIVTPDDIAPSFTSSIPVIETIETDQPTYVHIGTTWNTAATDNCEVSSLVYQLSGQPASSGTSLDGIAFKIGLTTVTWTATDPSGNFSSLSFDVNVNDIGNPEILCVEDQNAEINSGCSYVHSGLSWDPTASDNSGSVSLSYSLSGSTISPLTPASSLDGVSFNVGTTIVTWQAEDPSGNVSTCSFEVTITEAVKPVISIPITNEVINILSGCGYTIDNTSWDATATDNCTSNPTLTYTLTGVTEDDGTSLEGVVFNVGVTTITWKATDASGNTSEESIVMTVKETEAPVVTCSITGQVEVTLESGCTYLHAGTSWDATATDNCGIQSFGYTLTGATERNGQTLDNVAFEVGLTIVTWTAVDISGNTSSHTFTVKVTDNIKPTITCQTGNIPVSINAGCTYQHDGISWDATADDNCQLDEISFTLSGATTKYGTTLDDAIFSLGVTTVTWTAKDKNGNSENCSFTITVSDQVAPEITCPVTDPMTISTSHGCTYIHNGSDWNASATDNCNTIKSLTYNLTGATNGTGTSLGNVIFNLGTTRITWTATDNADNTSTCSFDLTVTDNKNPSLTLPSISSPIVSTNQACSYLHSGTGWDATASDNCTLQSLTYNLTGVTTGTGNSLAGVVFNLGKTTVTWTAADNAGNVSTGYYEVTVQDVTKPVITCPTPAVSYTTDAGKCTSSQSFTATATDNCGIASIKYYVNASEISFPYDFQVGTTTVTATATDNTGNASSCSFNVVVVDNEAPVITCPVPAAQYSNDAGKCSARKTFTATATDQCGAAVIRYYVGASEISFPYDFPVGTTTVRALATDAKNNQSECSFDVKVVDDEQPVITCPSVLASYNNDSNKCSAILNIKATATDNCGITSLKHFIASTEITFPYEFPVGVTLVTAVAIDNSGKQVTCDYTIVVKDTESPKFTCPQPLASYNADLGKCTKSLDFSVTAIDNCDIPQVRYTVNGSDITFPYEFPVGSTVVYVSAKDNSGNEMSCPITVKVIDSQLPVITCPTVPMSIVNDPGRCGSRQSFPATVTDNCGIQSTRYLIGATHINFPYEFPVGTTIVSVIARDNSGNESNCSFTVNVVDNEKPVIQCPTLLASYPNQSGKCSASMTFTATATDNCGIAQVTYSVNGTPITFPYEFPIGSTIVTAQARDNSNNLSSSCSFTVTIVDKELPSITCPVTQASYNTDPGMCSASLTFAATASDGCGSVQLRYIVGGNIITFPYNFPAGSTLVTAVARDNSGNERSCNFTVIVKDTEVPVIIAPNNIVSSLGSACVTNISVPSPVISDNCTITKLTWTMTGSTIAQSPLLGVNNVPTPYTFNEGITTVTYTVEDAGGNKASATFTVTVNDNTAPIFNNCPSDITVELPADQCSAVVNYTLPTATDCNLVSVVRTSGLASGSSFPAGVTTVVYTATDNAGNTSTCSFKVTVKDVTPPVITCPSPKVLEINANCNVTLTDIEIGTATATDNCSSVTITNDIPADKSFPVGHNYITWTATDASGNKATCKQLISVTRGIALVNYSYSNYTASTVINGTIQPFYTAPGVTSVQSFSSQLLSDDRVMISSTGIIPGSAAFLQSTDAQPGLFTDFKNTNSMQYYQFEIKGLGTTYSAFYLYFQFNRDNNSDPNKIYIEYSTNGTDYTRSLEVDLKKYNPNTWYEIYQSLTGISQLNNSPDVYIRIYYEYQGNPKVLFDNFQYSAFNKDIATGSVTATNVNCPGDLTGTITVNNTSPGIWEYTINGGLTWQTDNKFTGLGVGMYDVRMRMPDMVSCDVVIDVALPIKSNDVAPPVITCQAPVEVATTNVANTSATIAVNNPTVTDGCSQPQNLLVNWVTTGATSLSGTGLIGTQTFNVGTTNILFTVTDEAGNSSTCTLTVTVLEKPEISCPANIPSWIANPGTCTYTGFPDVPEILKGANVTLTWVMSGATTGSGTGLINSYTFNVGTTTITWTATNKVGTVSCTQTIIVTDKEAPTFAIPEDFSLCVEDLYQAVYEDSNEDIQPDRPEYYLFSPGDKVFDLDITTFKDNCCTVNSSNLQWTINTFGSGSSTTSGTGQPSTYSGEIKLPGDGITFNDVVHMITYTLTDCNNNAQTITIPITIKPRPNVIKML